MGREVRKVPHWWEHPKDENDNLIPLLPLSFSEMLTEWEEGQKQWNMGYRQDYSKDGRQWKLKDRDDTGTFAEWDGEKPEDNQYMPDWPEEEKTHLQMYEDCTEGTPISPVFESPEPLAKWLADNEASAMGSSTATYEQWLGMILGSGWAPTFVMTGGQGKTGVADIGDRTNIG